MKIIVWADNNAPDLAERGRRQAHAEFPGARVVVRTPAFYRPGDGEPADAVYLTPETAYGQAIARDYGAAGGRVLLIGVESADVPGRAHLEAAALVEELEAARRRIAALEAEVEKAEEALRLSSDAHRRATERVLALEKSLKEAAAAPLAAGNEDLSTAEAPAGRPRRNRG